MRIALRALLVAVVAASATQAGAAARGSTPVVTVPESIAFWNTHDGLLVTGQCRQPRLVPCKRGAVELTTDGGQTYRVVLRVPASLGTVQTVGAHGAVVTTLAGESWRTLDGGRSWSRVPSRPVVSWLTPKFGVNLRSYESGNQSALALRVTRDGGRTWSRRPDPCDKVLTFTGFAEVVTPQLWWVACLGEPGAGNEDKAIYRTRNGGATWRAGAATVLVASGKREHGGISEYGYPSGLAFSSDGFGLLTESRGTLYVTRDGGAHFVAEPHVARPEIDFAGGAAAFPGGTGYVLLTDDTRGRLIETHDYGRTWQVVRRWQG